MPQGCATWPAVWEVREDGWPQYGEVDIVEGVNDVSPNRAALHTTSNCTMPAGVPMTGCASTIPFPIELSTDRGLACDQNAGPTRLRLARELQRGPRRPLHGG